MKPITQLDQFSLGLYFTKRPTEYIFIKVDSMMSINCKTKLILSFVCAFMIFDIDVMHCCSKPRPIPTTKAPDTATSKASDANTMDPGRE